MNKIERMDRTTAEAMRETGIAARKAQAALATASSDIKNAALHHAAAALRRDANLILDANAKDLDRAKGGERPASFIDRMTLTEMSVEAIAKGLEDIAKLDDPVGAIITAWTRPNGLSIERKRVPIGVIGIIYESRPNVTADAGALCLKSGNAAILRGGSESHLSSLAIQACLAEGLKNAGLPETAIQSVTTTDRDAVGLMLQGLDGNIDLIVPRGGKSLVARVQNEARVPVFAHLEGICHTYIDRAADIDMAKRVIVNAKMRRPGVCGATECLLIDSALPASVRGEIITALLDAGCEVRGDQSTLAADPRVKAAAETDYGYEFLDAIIAVKTVDGVEGAIDHIARYGSQHTDAIITEASETAERFLARVDSAIVLWNASTQFADGGEFGFGAEIGIATGKLHARGPVGVEQLTTFKYVVRGKGQTRPR